MGDQRLRGAIPLRLHDVERRADGVYIMTIDFRAGPAEGAQAIAEPAVGNDVVGVTEHADPVVVDDQVEVVKAMLAGDLPTARELQTRANDVIDVLIDVGVFPGTKAILKGLGMDCGECRRPFSALTSAQQVKVDQLVASKPWAISATPPQSGR